MAAGVSTADDLHRFIEAQDPVFEAVLAELLAGSKKSHWMWFIFPQLRGLGRSPISQFYGLASLSDARAYLEDEVLGPRLRQCVEALLEWAPSRSADQILGSVDALKLRSSLTLFHLANPDDLFRRALEAFFDGQYDERTLALLSGQE